MIAMRLGFIGLGNLGAKLVDDLLIRISFDSLTLFDVNTDALKSYLTTAATPVESITEIAQSKPDVVGICVQTDQQLRDVVVGPSGLLAGGLPAASLIAVHSTVHPETCRELAANAATKGIALVDAPITNGGQGPGGTPTRVVLVGGDEAVVAQYLPYFEGMAQVVEHAGDLGAGQVIKLVNNLLLTANVGTAAAAFGAAEKLCVRFRVLRETLMNGSGFSQGVRIFLYEERAAHNVDLLGKDVTLASEVLKRGGCEATMLESGGRAGVKALVRVAQRTAAGTTTP
jgi:3-hydroxyisobutyrate dehydrogenase